MSDYTKALRAEREACENAGKSDRLAAIDAELDRLAGAAEKRSGEDESPRGRRPRGRATTQG